MKQTERKAGRQATEQTNRRRTELNSLKTTDNRKTERQRKTRAHTHYNSRLKKETTMNQRQVRGSSALVVVVKEEEEEEEEALLFVVEGTVSGCGGGGGAVGSTRKKEERGSVQKDTSHKQTESYKRLGDKLIDCPDDSNSDSHYPQVSHHHHQHYYQAWRLPCVPKSDNR